MKVIITAGGTTAKIDQVRKITNMSTGKLGTMIAEELLYQAADNVEKIYYVCEEHATKPSLSSPLLQKKIEIVTVEGVPELESKLRELLSTEKIDCVVHSMAISDYMTKNVTTVKMLAKYVTMELDFVLRNNSRIFTEMEGFIEQFIQNNTNIIDNSNKISSDEDNLIVNMVKTPKIISIIKEIQPTTFLVGFKLLDNVSKDELFNVAYHLLLKNHCDLVLANDLADIKKGNHIGLLIRPDGTHTIHLGKSDIAKNLVSAILNSKAKVLQT